MNGGVLDVTPDFPAFNLAHRRLTEFVFFRNGSLGSVVCANILYLFLCQFRCATSLAYWRSALLGTIPHIVSLRSKEQMRRVHARRNVAFMQNEQPVRNWTVRQFPRHAVRVDRPSHLEHTVAEGLAYLGGPKPTRFGLLDLLPESFSDGDTLASSHAATAPIGLVSVRGARWMGVHPHSAILLPM